MESLISVIVPVYNVSKYLEKCIESIVGQTYKNLEIILVDDGSTDDSGIICDNFANGDERIKVFHTENHGLAAARNLGLDNAHGDYISFIDSDDYIKPDFCARMLETFESTETAIALCDIEEQCGSNKKILELRGNGEDGFSVDLEDLKAPSYIASVIAMNKMYTKDIWEGLRYPVGRLHEDEFVIYSILLKIQKFYYVKEPLYVYVRRDDSITGSNNGYSVRHLDVLDAYENRISEALTVGDMEVASITTRNMLARAYELYYIYDTHDKRKLAEEFYKEGFRKYKKLLNLKRRLKYYVIDLKLKKQETTNG